MEKILHSVVDAFISEVKPLLEQLEQRELRRRHIDAACYIQEIYERFELSLRDALPDLYKCSQKGCRNEALDQADNEQPSVCTLHDPGR